MFEIKLPYGTDVYESSNACMRHFRMRPSSKFYRKKERSLRPFGIQIGPIDVAKKSLKTLVLQNLYESTLKMLIIFKENHNCNYILYVVVNKFSIKNKTLRHRGFHVILCKDQFNNKLSIFPRSCVGLMECLIDRSHIRLVTSVLQMHYDP